MQFIRRVIGKLLRDGANLFADDGRFRFFDLGFHGDKYLMALADAILSNSNYFIETGTNVGSTLSYVARKHPYLSCFSCEPDTEAFKRAAKNCSTLNNVWLFNETSQEFFLHLQREFGEVFVGDILFWIDSHGYGFEWPLREEVAFITSRFEKAFVLIDDFKVPGLDVFGYDEYDGQICSFDFIRDSINPALSYNLYYPTYQEQTTGHHPLRGWGLLEFGHEEKFELPKHLRDKVASQI